MSAQKELQSLARGQGSSSDSVRIFKDGSIKLISLTDSGKIGWRVVANPVRGVPPRLQSHFISWPDGGEYLKVPELQDAIHIRDLIVEESIAFREFKHPPSYTRM